MLAFFIGESIFQIVETSCSDPGMSPTTILHGHRKFETDLAGDPELHMRAAGGGWAVTEKRDPELEQALETVLALGTAYYRTMSQGRSQFLAAIEHGTEGEEICRQPSSRLKAIACAEVYFYDPCAAYRSPGCFCERASTAVRPYQ